VALTGSGLRLLPAPGTLLGAGALAGFLGTTSSVGGPPIALVYQHETGPRIRGTLSAFFVVGVVLSLIGLHVVDRFGAVELRLALALLPAAVAGFLLSRRTARWVDAGRTRLAVLAASGASGLFVVVRELV
jgi:uncharacterized membrane protein YfcA